MLFVYYKGVAPMEQEMQAYIPLEKDFQLPAILFRLITRSIFKLRGVLFHTPKQ